MSVATKTQKSATTTTTVELSAVAVKALNAFNKAKAAALKAKTLKDKAEAILRAELGDARAATVEGVVALRLVAGKTTYFDRELMLELYPEAFEATLKTTEYDYIKTL